jgi:hypothetical protein
MFKFYSQVVGTKYLFLSLARVVNELNAVTEQAIREREKQSRQKGEDNDTETTASLLTIEMEVDPNRIKDANVDTDTNIYQLSLTCQKIFTAIQSSHEKVPPYTLPNKTNNTSHHTPHLQTFCSLYFALFLV